MGNRMVRRSEGFGPVAGPDARVLILGSLPGAESLRRHEYYAHPRNAFWPIVGQLFGAAPDLSYQLRLRRLILNRIALWDVCASAERMGSSDSALALVAANDFGAFFAEHPGIQLICFNGSKAGELYRRRVLPYLPQRPARIPRVVLPSTSPARAAMTLEEKLKTWQKELANVAQPGSMKSGTFLTVHGQRPRTSRRAMLKADR